MGSHPHAAATALDALQSLPGYGRDLQALLLDGTVWVLHFRQGIVLHVNLVPGSDRWSFQAWAIAPGDDLDSNRLAVTVLFEEARSENQPPVAEGTVPQGADVWPARGIYPANSHVKAVLAEIGIAPLLVDPRFGLAGRVRTDLLLAPLLHNVHGLQFDVLSRAPQQVWGGRWHGYRFRFAVHGGKALLDISHDDKDETLWAQAVPVDSSPVDGPSSTAMSDLHLYSSWVARVFPQVAETLANDPLYPFDFNFRVRRPDNTRSWTPGRYRVNAHNGSEALQRLRAEFSHPASPFAGREFHIDPGWTATPAHLYPPQMPDFRIA